MPPKDQKPSGQQRARMDEAMREFERAVGKGAAAQRAQHVGERTKVGAHERRVAALHVRREALARGAQRIRVAVQADQVAAVRRDRGEQRRRVPAAAERAGGAVRAGDARPRADGARGRRRVERCERAPRRRMTRF